MNSSRFYAYHLLSRLLLTTRIFSIKCNLLRWTGAKFGVNVRIVCSARFYLTGRFEKGNNRWVGHEVLVARRDSPFSMRDGVDIASRVTIVTGLHKAFSLEGKTAGEYSFPVPMGDGACVGGNASILGGVALGELPLIVASALVHSSVGDAQMVSGVPAFCLGKRKKESA